MLTTELRQRHHLQHGREQVELTQKQLAAFRRENTTIETILSQQRHDRETKAALKVLEGGKAPKGEQVTPREPSEREALPSPEAPDGASTLAKPYDQLLVLKRIRL